MAEEEKLLMRLKNGKRNAIDEAIAVYTPYLSTVLYNMLGNRLPKEDIEEILSDVFVTLWKNADTIDLEKGTLRAYLAAVARNFALKKLNKQRDYTSLDEIELPDEAPIPSYSPPKLSFPMKPQFRRRIRRRVLSGMPL